MYFALNYRCFVPKTWLSFRHVTNRKRQNMMFSKWIKHTVLATTITVFSAASYSLIAKGNTTSHGCNCPSKLQVASTEYFPTGSCQARAWQLGSRHSRVWQPPSPSLAAATLTPSLVAAEPEFDSCLAAVQMPKAENPGYISGSHWDLNTIYMI